MNENITKMYKNGMVTLDAEFFNVYQETIDSYIHNWLCSANGDGALVCV